MGTPVDDAVDATTLDVITEEAQPGVSGKGGLGRSFASRRTTAIGLFVLVLGMAVWAVAGSAWLEPNLSSNADEPSYLRQAELLTHGKIAVETPRGLEESFRPWFGVETDHGYVFKYTPPWPAILAPGVAIGFPELGLAVAVVLFLSGTYALAMSVLHKRAQALLATVLVALSPTVVLLSASYLTYIFFGGLWTWAATFLVQGVARKRPSLLVAAGALSAIAFWARPYDAIITLVPFFGWAVWTLRHDLARLARLVGWAALGAAPIVVATAAYNVAVTGSPTEFPYTRWSSTDKPGFGQRGLDPFGSPILDYTFHNGVRALRDGLWAMQWWSFGGIALVGVAIVGLVFLARRTTLAVALAVAALAVPVAYVGFWGHYGSTVYGDFDLRFGPFYYLPLVVPVGILAAAGLSRLWATRRAALIAVATVMVVFAGVGLSQGLGVALDERDARREPYQFLAERFPGDERALVLLPQGFTDQMLPDLHTENPQRDVPVIYANSAGNQQIDLVQHFSDHPAYRLDGCGFDGSGPLASRRVPEHSAAIWHLADGARLRLVPVELVRAPTVKFRVTIPSADLAADSRVVVAAAKEAVSAPVRPATGRVTTIDVTVSPDGTTLTGDVGRTRPVASEDRELNVYVVRASSKGSPPHDKPDFAWDMPIRFDRDAVTYLGPLGQRTVAYSEGTVRPELFSTRRCGKLAAAQTELLP